MNIFFLGAIRGGRDQQPQYSKIVILLKQQGILLSDHVAEDILPRHGETELAEQDIHDRELARLDQCDVVVAEVTTPSLGVGYLIAQALNKQKRVVCLYQGKNSYNLSAMIKGDQNIELYQYENLSELESLVQNIFSK